MRQVDSWLDATIPGGLCQRTDTSLWWLSTLDHHSSYVSIAQARRWLCRVHLQEQDSTQPGLSLDRRRRLSRCLCFLSLLQIPCYSRSWRFSSHFRLRNFWVNWWENKWLILDWIFLEIGVRIESVLSVLISLYQFQFLIFLFRFFKFCLTSSF